MAVPKRRLSKCRRDRRRANWKLTVPGFVACPQCHEPMMPLGFALHAVIIKELRL